VSLVVLEVQLDLCPVDPVGLEAQLLQANLVILEDQYYLEGLLILEALLILVVLESLEDQLLQSNLVILEGQCFLEDQLNLVALSDQLVLHPAVLVVL